MILIAESAGVDFRPDPDVMRDDEVAQAEQMLIDFKNAGSANPRPPPSDGAGSGSGGAGGGGYGWQYQGGPPSQANFPPQCKSHARLSLSLRLQSKGHTMLKMHSMQRHMVRPM